MSDNPDYRREVVIVESITLDITGSATVDLTKVGGVAIATPTVEACVPISIENPAIAYDGVNDRFKIDIEKWSATDTVKTEVQNATIAVTQSGEWAVTVTGAVTVSGTVAATQSGTWAVTVTGAVTVSGTVAATQSGEWAVAATQSGAWEVSIIGTIDIGNWSATDTVNVEVQNATLAVTQSGAWTVAAIQSGAWEVTVNGTITANAGTNLNTSALALESGGNLATLAGKDFATQTTLSTLNGKVPSDPAKESGKLSTIDSSMTALKGALDSVGSDAIRVISI